MLKKASLLSALLLTYQISFSQTTFLPIGSEDNHVLDRLETLSGRLCDTLCTGDKPESRRNAIIFLEFINSKHNSGENKAEETQGPKLSNIDQYNVDQMISESGEWTHNELGAIRSKHPIINFFYLKQYDMLHLKDEDFFVVDQKFSV